MKKKERRRIKEFAKSEEWQKSNVKEGYTRYILKSVGKKKDKVFIANTLLKTQ